MRVRKTWLWAFGIFFLDVMLMAQVTESGSSVSHYDGTDWNLKGTESFAVRAKFRVPVGPTVRRATAIAKPLSTFASSRGTTAP